MASDSNTGVAGSAMDACWVLLRSTDVRRLAVSVAGITPRNVSGRRFHAVDRASWHPPLTDAHRASLD